MKFKEASETYEERRRNRDTREAQFNDYPLFDEIDWSMVYALGAIFCAVGAIVLTMIII